MPAVTTMNQPLIRPMLPEDRDAVVALLKDSEPWIRLGYVKSDWDRYFCPLPQGREAFVAEQGGQIAGIAVIRHNFLFGEYLELFGVAKETRRTGIGQALLTYVESFVFAKAKNLFVCVSDFNRPARKFYERQGYEEVGPIQHLLIQGSAEILLRKTTGPARQS